VNGYLNRKADGDAAVFSDLEETIPTLLDNLRKFPAENPLMRDLIVLETKSMGYDWPGIHLRFSEDEDPGIYTQVALLVNHGLVDEVQHEFAYRITERLARYLRKK
jgi:hypothetical protein